MNRKPQPEFPLDDSIIYLNHAAVAPWPLRTARAVQAFASENVRFGAAHYLNWLKQQTTLRRQLKRLINAPSVDDIALLKNTSEALSVVAYGLEWQSGDNIVSSDQEFPSNRIPWQSLASQGVEFRQASLTEGSDPEQQLFDQVDCRTRLITISSIQFASGLALDLNRIGQFCRDNKILFCIDAIQSLGAVQLDVQACCADFIMADGHKWMLGPEGLALFYSTPEARAQLSLKQFGWHRVEERLDYSNRPWKATDSALKFECGSANMLGIHALSASLSLLLEVGMEVVEASVLSRAAYLIERIIEADDLTLLSASDPHPRSGIVLFRHHRVDDEILYRQLMKRGVICANRNGIRFSPHFYTTDQQLDRALSIVAEIGS